MAICCLLFILLIVHHYFLITYIPHDYSNSAHNIIFSNICPLFGFPLVVGKFKWSISWSCYTFKDWWSLIEILCPLVGDVRLLVRIAMLVEGKIKTILASSLDSHLQFPFTLWTLFSNKLLWGNTIISSSFPNTLSD